MRYQNPVRIQTRPETATQGEKRELLRLLLTVTALVVGTIFILDRAAWWLAPKIPFAWEAAIAQKMGMDTLPVNMVSGKASSPSPHIHAIESELQRRADRIAQALGVPADMKIQAHYIESPVVNAVATLGGHITVFQGLLHQLEYEEELDAVLAHEIGHVMHRHLVQHMGRGITAAVALEAIGVHSASLTRWLIGDMHQLQQLAYSRNAEREADQAARYASQVLYGHTEGMVSLFRRFQALKQEKGSHTDEMLSFLQSHPLPEERITTAVSQTHSPHRLTALPALLRPEKTTGNTATDSLPLTRQQSD